LLERPGDLLPAAPVQKVVPAPAAGFVTAWQGEALGHAVVQLGGGRRKGGDTIDPSVGLGAVAPVGTGIDADAPLAVVHAATEDAAEVAVAAVQAAVTIGSERPARPDLLYGRIPQ
ncbi:MAG: thymidine phosphorylase, partial [Pseudomonadota bacterium]